MTAKLTLSDGSEFTGINFGAEQSIAGEVVFSTGMMGYPESLTDPSYKGQILILTYPLIGNYGIPHETFWESDRIMVSGLIVSQYIDTPSHFQSQQTLANWFKKSNIPLLEIKDTRFLTQKIREHGVMLGKIIADKDIPFYDPNNDNLVSQVSSQKVTIQNPNSSFTVSSNILKKSQLFTNRMNQKRILLIDCGAKRNIQKSLLGKDAIVITIPWDFDPFEKQNNNSILEQLQSEEVSNKVNKSNLRNDNIFDGILISNGPGDPKKAESTIAIIQKALKTDIPILGICLGHQLLALAAGGDTKKLKYGHRSQNQPCGLKGSKRCYITTQNHGFAVTEFPSGFKPWFTNANDNSNEGIIHKKRPIMSVQFHPEATPGPEDTGWIFDYFLEKIKK